MEMDKKGQTSSSSKKPTSTCTAQQIHDAYGFFKRVSTVLEVPNTPGQIPSSNMLQSEKMRTIKSRSGADFPTDLLDSVVGSRVAVLRIMDKERPGSAELASKFAQLVVEYTAGEVEPTEEVRRLDDTTHYLNDRPYEMQLLLSAWSIREQERDRKPFKPPQLRAKLKEMENHGPRLFDMIYRDDVSSKNPLDTGTFALAEIGMDWAKAEKQELRTCVTRFLENESDVDPEIKTSYMKLQDAIAEIDQTPMSIVEDKHPSLRLWIWCNEDTAAVTYRTAYTLARTSFSREMAGAMGNWAYEYVCTSLDKLQLSVSDGTSAAPVPDDDADGDVLPQILGIAQGALQYYGQSQWLSRLNEVICRHASVTSPEGTIPHEVAEEGYLSEESDMAMEARYEDGAEEADETTEDSVADKESTSVDRMSKLEDMMKRLEQHHEKVKTILSDLPHGTPQG